jgi:hypothetical protein
LKQLAQQKSVNSPEEVNKEEVKMGLNLGPYVKQSVPSLYKQINLQSGISYWCKKAKTSSF